MPDDFEQLVIERDSLDNPKHSSAHPHTNTKSKQKYTNIKFNSLLSSLQRDTKYRLFKALILSVILTAFSIGVSQFAIISKISPKADPNDLRELKSVDFIGTVSDDSVICKRDVGSTGYISGKIIWVFGDTITYNDKMQMRGLTCNTASFGNLRNATETSYKDLSSRGIPTEFVPFTQEELDYNNEYNSGTHRYGMWVSNPVDIGDGKGVVYFNKNLIQGKEFSDISNMGTGIAIVSVDGDSPTAERIGDFLFDNTVPYWGTFTTFAENGYVYPFGKYQGGIYLSRVKNGDVTNKDKYEYWNGKSWGSSLLTYPNEEAQIFWGMQAGSVFYSPYFHQYVLIYTSTWTDNLVRMKRADSLTGEWGHDVVLTRMPVRKTASLAGYCSYAHPEFDPSGRSLLVSWTDPGNGTVKAAKANFR